MWTSVELWGLLAHTTRTFVAPLLTNCNGEKKSPDGAAARKMLSEGWTAEPTGCDRLFLQSSHLLRRTFQIPLLFQALNSSWAHQGQPVEWRHDLNSVHMPGLLLLFITLPATLCCQLSLWTHCVYESSVTKHAASWYLSVSPQTKIRYL